MMEKKTMKIIQSIPQKNFYFKEKMVECNNVSEATEAEIINIFANVVYQEIIGFGGAFTESSAYNYSLMDKKTREKFMKAYFDTKEGIGYNFGRTHMNSCDFSLNIYANVTEGDKTLQSFNIERDKKYIIPFLKDAMAYCDDDIILFASPWSPPSYMKDNNSMVKVHCFRNTRSFGHIDMRNMFRHMQRRELRSLLCLSKMNQMLFRLGKAVIIRLSLKRSLLKNIWLLR